MGTLISKLPAIRDIWFQPFPKYISGKNIDRVVVVGNSVYARRRVSDTTRPVVYTTSRFKGRFAWPEQHSTDQYYLRLACIRLGLVSKHHVVALEKLLEKKQAAEDRHDNAVKLRDSARGLGVPLTARQSKMLRAALERRLTR